MPRRAVALALLAAALAPAASRALVVNGDPAEVARAPAPGMGFEHVGKIGGTTGVYLGRGFVLTAWHVGAGEIWLAGVKYTPVAGSWAQLKAPGAVGPSRPDLGLFRVTPEPPLPNLAIVRRTPAIGDPLFLVGAGHGRGERFEWNGRSGFHWAAPNIPRWGTNRVAAVGIDLPRAGTSTRVFASLFSSGERHEAQAALGDSGGAGFVRQRRAWVLAGIMVSVVAHPGQPPMTSVDGNATELADLSYYRDEILALTGLPGDAAPTGPKR